MPSRCLLKAVHSDKMGKGTGWEGAAWDPTLPAGLGRARVTARVKARPLVCLVVKVKIFKDYYGKKNQSYSRELYKSNYLQLGGHLGCQSHIPKPGEKSWRSGGGGNSRGVREGNGGRDQSPFSERLPAVSQMLCSYSVIEITTGGLFSPFDRWG